MKFIYPAVFEQTEDKKYKGYFPDLEACYASGDSMMDAIDDAREAAANWIGIELEDPEAILPMPTEAKDIILKENQAISNIVVHVNVVGGWREYQPVRPV
ncbi:MAG: type II toxin-antitoxin system HicB family antitoxin [Lachnospiraceae bacterium]|nr:type II toxin-antitoxin system HicB family antitoxin [Lachnospiraceae bacterium]